MTAKTMAASNKLFPAKVVPNTAVPPGRLESQGPKVLSTQGASTKMPQMP